MQENNKEKRNKKTAANGVAGTGEKPKKTVFPNIATPSPTIAANTSVAAGNASRKKQEDDYFMQQMAELFKGKVITAGTEKMDSRDFWRFDTSAPE